jgi:outer membrane protein assembly factor BamA
LFNSNDRLPPNPPIDDGVRTTVSGSLVYDSREEPAWPGSAWRLRLWGEKGFDGGPGEFDYGAFQFELNRYQNLPYDLHLDVRGRLFSTIDPAPSQTYQTLGGYGGIRGLTDHPFPVYRGDRLALLSGELRRSLPDVRYISAFFTSWNVILFSDIGLLALAEDPYDSFGFLDAPFEDWGKSIGLGVSGESILPYVGVYVAHDLDRGGSLRAILRIERSF